MTANAALFSSIFATCALTLYSPSAGATSAQLAYSAPEGCPAESAFVSAVEARGAALERATEPRLLNVQIERVEGGFSGSLQVGEGRDASGARHVHAATCMEVSDALAVVAAIALGGGAEPRVAAVESDATPPAAPVTVSVAARPPVVILQPSPGPVVPPGSAVETILGKDKVDVTAGQLSFGYIGRYTLSAGAALGVIPQLTLPRFDFSMSRAQLVTTPGDQNFLLGSAFRVRWSFLGPAVHHAPGFDTRVLAIKAGLGACTPLKYDPNALVLELCSEIAAGAMGLETRAADGTKTQSKSVGIGTGSLELHSQYNLGSALYVDLNLGGEMWVSKVSAERPDGSRLFQSSTFNAYALAGLGLRF